MLADANTEQRAGVYVELRFRLGEIVRDFDELADKLADLIDGTLAEHDGVRYVIAGDEGDPIDVAVRLATAVAEVTNVSVEVDEDLVDLTEIANRIGRSRESVRLWSLGRRGPGGFPTPLGILPGSVKVWDWGSVHAWVRRAVPGLVGNDRHLTRHEMAEVMVRLADSRTDQHPARKEVPAIEHIDAILRSVQGFWPMRGNHKSALHGWARASR